MVMGRTGILCLRCLWGLERLEMVSLNHSRLLLRGGMRSIHPTTTPRPCKPGVPTLPVTLPTTAGDGSMLPRGDYAATTLLSYSVVHLSDNR